MSTILTDCDGVLLDWADGYALALQERLGSPRRTPVFPLTPQTPVEWARDAYDMSVEDAVWSVRQFQTSPYFGSLLAYPDALAWVPRIAADFGVRFVVISSPGESPITQRLRTRNLQCFGPDVFQSIHLLAPGASKAEMLAEHPSCLWFDDHPEHVLAGHAAGHHAFHFDRGSDMVQGMPGRVSDWGAVHAWLRHHPPQSWGRAA